MQTWLFGLMVCSSLVASMPASPPTGDFDALVGGEGVKETPVFMQEDEGSGICIECTMDKMRLPDDFSGDLNEFAEQAYAPTEEQLKQIAESFARPEDDDEKSLQPVRPGEELIGGEGLVEAEAETEINLEMGEGRGTAEEPAQTVVHRSDILKRDVEEKEMLLDSLKSTIQKLKEDNAATNEELTNYDKLAQEEIEKAKEEAEAALKREDERYNSAVESIRHQGREKAATIRKEEEHIELRADIDDEKKFADEQQNLQTALSNAEKELLDEQKAADEAEKREMEAMKRQHIFENVQEESTETLRGRLSSVKHAIEDVEQRANQEDGVLKQLDGMFRKEQKAKEILDSRLKNLHLREEAVMEKQHELEATNANLRHQLDEREVAADDDVESVAKAREDARQMAKTATESAETAAADAKRSFEIQAVHAAQDEVVRLKEELARHERREAHAEQELLQQEQVSRETEAKADEIMSASQNRLQEANKQVEEVMNRANELADAIVAAAEAEGQKIRDVSQKEGSDESKAAIRSKQRANHAKEAEIAKAEEQAKKLSAELRKKIEQKMAADDKVTRDTLLKEHDELLSKLEETTQQELKRLESASEKQIDDVGADWMASKIRADKDAQEIEMARKRQDSLRSEIDALKKKIAAQKEEWEFQQFAQSHPVTYSPDSN